MPTKVPTLVLKGLAEGLTLHAAEREPTDAEGLEDRFEQLLGHRPHANQIESVLREVREADYVRGPESSEDEQFQLTQEGARRLEAYRRLPQPFKRSLVELFRIRPNAIVEQVDAQIRRSDSSGETRTETGGWVAAALGEIPAEVEVKAQYARVSMDRDPAGRSWTLRVEQHEPGRYEGAETCPLTFLYRAATRLLSQAKGPRRGRASHSLPSNV